MGTYGKGKGRPVGNAGRGKHTGKVGYLGGNHRKNDGCLDAFFVIVGTGAAIAGGAVYGVTQAVQAIF